MSIWIVDTLEAKKVGQHSPCSTYVIGTSKLTKIYEQDSFCKIFALSKKIVKKTILAIFILSLK